jgi:hypothetical protein
MNVNHARELIAFDMLAKAFGHNGGGLERVDVSLWTNQVSHVQSHLTEICSRINADHAGLHITFDTFIDVVVMSAECDDYSINVVVWVKQQLRPPPVSMPIKIFGIRAPFERSLGNAVRPASRAETSETVPKSS